MNTIEGLKNSQAAIDCFVRSKLISDPDARLVASEARAKALDEAAFVCRRLRYAMKEEIRERESRPYGPTLNNGMLQAEYDAATKLEKAILALKDKQS